MGPTVTTVPQADPSPVLPLRSPRKSLRPTVFWRIAEEIPRSLHNSLTILSVAIPLALWLLLASAEVVNPRFLPSPQQVAQALIHLWQEGYLLKDILASIGRVGGGFCLAALVALPLGISMGAFASIRALFEPIAAIFRYMPAPAFIPLLIIYLGLDEPPKIALIFIGTVFFNLLMIMDAVNFVPQELIEATYTLGGVRWQVLLQVITPYIVPNIINTFRINIAASWNLVVVAELVAANEGLGKRIQLAQRFFKTDEIFACLMILGLIGFVLDLSFRALLRTTCKWALE